MPKFIFTLMAIVMGIFIIADAYANGAFQF